MKALCIFSYIIFGLVLFYLIDIKLNGKINKQKKIIFSLIYLLIVSGIFSYVGLEKFNNNIFVIIVIEFMFNLIYISYFLEKDYFTSENKYLKNSLILIGIAFLVNVYFINKVDTVFLNSSELKIIVWLGIAFYIYKCIVNKDRDYEEILDKKKSISKEEIVVSYAKLKLKYDKNIEIKNKNLRLILYSCMILGNYNRPKLLRKVDNIKFRLNPEKTKLGITQIESKKSITDYEAIDITAKLIENTYKKLEKDKVKKSTIYNEVIKKIAKKDVDNIMIIYKELEKFNEI